MEKLNIQEFSTGLGIATAVIFVLFFNRIKAMILYIFGGQLDKTEFGGLIFTAAFLWMLHKEGTRTSEWHLFSELYILVVASAALIGLGLNAVLDYLKEIRNSGTNSSTREVVIKKTEVKTANGEESESPK